MVRHNMKNRVKVADENTTKRELQQLENNSVVKRDALKELSRQRHIYFKNSIRSHPANLYLNNKERENGFNCPPSCQ